MATLKIIAPNQTTDSVLVNVRVTHKRKHRFINTEKYIDRSDLEPNGDVPMEFIIDYLAEDYKIYKNRLRGIKNINSLTVDEVKSIVEHGENLESPANLKARTDFIVEANNIIEKYITSKILDKEDSTIAGYKRSLLKFTEYFGTSVMLTNITRKSVKAWYEWMIEKKELKLSTGRLYYYRVNRLFEDMMEKLNDIDNDFIVIPFKSIQSNNTSKGQD